MNRDLDQKLCEKYPKIFANRYSDMTETAMCWGFDCGDGWFNIIDTLCACIQNHLDWLERTRQHALEFNEALAAAQAGNLEPLRKTLGSYIDVDDRIKKILERGPMEVPDPVPQVVAEQVKEKFGGLRFYYTGGDDAIQGMAQLAEALSDQTCEACGAPGHARGGGWIRTLCDVHADEHGVYTDENL